MNEDAAKIIRQAVIDGLTADSFVSPETHERHHRWTESQIKRAEACIANRRRITSHVLGWLAVTSISGIAFLLWLGFKYVTTGTME